MRLLTVAAFFFHCLFSTTLLAAEGKNKIEYVAVGNVPEDTMRETQETVDTHYRRIIRNFMIEDMPAVTVKIWQDRDEFERSYGEDAQYVQGYVDQDLWEARFFNGLPQLGLGVVHEYTHLVTLALNPSFNNNPRWLWEAIAIYESGRPPVPEASSLKCFSSNAYPTLESLENHPFNIYKVGYFLTDFILSKWGQEELIKLVESNGEIKQTLNISVKAFERSWLSFLQNKYQLKNSGAAVKDC